MAGCWKSRPANNSLTNRSTHGSAQSSPSRQVHDPRLSVREGIDRPSIWEDLCAHVLLEGEDFVEKLKGYVKGYGEMPKPSRNQLYVSRPLLKKLFDGKRAKVTHDTAIEQAVHRYGYSQREVADWLGLHYATVSRIANRP